MNGERNRGQRRRADEERPENTSVEGKVPPHDDDTEAGVLSTLMLRGAPAIDEVRSLVRPEDFYSEAHRRIAEACYELAAGGTTVDVLSVQGWLKDKQRLAQVGGSEYLMQVLEAAPVVSTEHLMTWAKRVRSKARQRRLAFKLQAAVARCYLAGTDDEVADLFETIERDVTEECSDRHSKGFARIGNILGDVMKSLDVADQLAREGRVPGISTGFTRFDQITGGLHDGDLTVVAARPGMGKTALVTGVLLGVAERGYAGAIFSLEMPSLQIGSRALFSSARIDLQRGRTGQLGQNDWSKLTTTAADLARLSIYVDDTAGITLAEIRSKLRRLVAELTREGKKLGVVIIDYLQIMDLQEERGETRDTAIGRVTRGLKRLAKELGIPIVLLSQLNRGLESRDNKRPRVADLRESGNIENDADNIVLIYRDDYYTKEESLEPNIAELLIEKQRNGPTGTVKLRFDKQWTRFDNLAEYDEAPEEQGSFDGL